MRGIGRDAVFTGAPRSKNRSVVFGAVALTLDGALA